MKNDLSSLLISEEEVASKAIVESLQGIVHIGKASGDPIPTADFEKLELPLLRCGEAGSSSVITAISAAGDLRKRMFLSSFECSDEWCTPENGCLAEVSGRRAGINRDESTNKNET